MTVGQLIEQLRQEAGKTIKGYDAEVHVAGGHYTANGQRLRVEATGEVVRIGSTAKAEAPRG